MKKRIIALVLCVAMMLALGACAPATPSNVMDYAAFVAAELNTEVTVDVYVQAKEGWWNNTCTIYAADKNGGYLLYSMPCTEEECAKLTPGTKIRVTGTKSEWSGEVEITWEETFSGKAYEILSGDTYVAPAKEVKAADLANYPNQLVTVKDMEIVASKNADGVESAFLYNWDGSGEAGNSDVYFMISDGTNSYSCNVRRYLTGKDTDVYKAAEALTIGQKVSVTCYVYMYSGEVQPRAIEIK